MITRSRRSDDFFNVDFSIDFSESCWLRQLLSEEFANASYGEVQVNLSSRTDNGCINRIAFVRWRLSSSYDTKASHCCTLRLETSTFFLDDMPYDNYLRCCATVVAPRTDSDR